MENLRTIANQTLAKASVDGSLVNALSVVKGEDDVDVDSLRTIAYDTLTKACEDGSLIQAFAETKGAAGVKGEQKSASSGEAIAPVRPPLSPASGSAKVQEVAEEIDKLRTLAAAEINDLRADARAAQADIKSSYDE